MDKWTWSSLFDFSGDSPLKELNRQLDEAIKKGQQLQETFGNNFSKISSDLNAIKDEAKGMAESLAKVNVEAYDSGKKLSQAATSVENLTTEFGALVTVEEEQKKVMSGIATGIDSLTKAKTSLKNVTVNETKSINDLKKELLAEEAAIKSGKGIKQEQLKRVAELSKQYNTANKAVQDAKKGLLLLDGSYSDLNQRVGQAKKELKEMGGAFDANNPKVQALKKFIKEGSDQLKEFDKSLGDNQRNVGNYEGALVDLKKEFKAAKDQMAGIAAALGEDSMEYKEAALHAGELQDRIGDINEASKAVSGEPIERLGGSFGLLTDKVRALDFKGAQGAINQFAEASKDLTFKQASQGLGGFTKSVGGLGKAILTNPLFLIVGTAAAITFAIVKLKDSIPFLSAAFETVGNWIDFAVQKGKDFLDWLGVSTFAADEKRRSIVDNSKLEVDAVSEAADRSIRIAQAQGKETLALEIQKQKDLRSLAEEGYKNTLDTNNQIKKGYEEDFKFFTKLLGDTNTEIQALTAQAEQERLKKQEEAQKERLDSRDKAHDEIIKLMKKHAKEDAEKEKELKEKKAQDFQDKANKSLDALEQFVSRELQIEITRKARLKKEEEDLNTELVKLRQQALTTAQDFFNYELEQENNHLSARRQRMEEFMAAELQAAGDNADAKASIESKYAVEFEELDRKERALKREQAVRDKAFAAFRIGINTLVAASEKGFVTPAAIAIYAIGSLELASVLAKPLPEFYKGTSYSPEGWAKVSERGAEIVERPGERPVLYDTPGAAITYLPLGSKVYTAEETESIVQGANFDRITDLYSGGSKSMRGNKSAGSQGKGGTFGKFDDSRIVSAIERQKYPDLVRVGSEIYEVRKAKDSSKSIIRSKSMGN